MIRGKKAISTLVATVLIILIVVIAITIVWMMIIPIIQTSLINSDITARASIITSEGYTYWDAGNQIVCVQVENKEGELEAIDIIIFAGDESYTKRMTPAPAKNMAKAYCFISGIGKPDKISVAPIVKVGSREKTLSTTSSIDKIPSGTYPSDSEGLETIGLGCGPENECSAVSGMTVECTNSQCDYTLIPCQNGDNFCPTGCNHNTDADCPEGCVDADGDGYNITTGCGTIDCNDNNATIWQNLPAYLDADRDNEGVGSQLQICSGNSLPLGYVPTLTISTTDCNDSNKNINHTALEICDGVDNDCDGITDEGCPCATYQCLIQKANLYLPFDDNLNNLGTSSVTAEMRNLNGNDKNKYQYLTGLSGKAIDFYRTMDSGDGDYVTTIGANSCLFRNLSCGTKTISFWIRTIQQPAFSNRAVIAGTMYVDHSSSTGGWSIGMNRIDGVTTGSQLTLEISSLPSNKKLGFYVSNSVNWINIVLILNNTDIRLYQNSILRDSLSGYGGFNPTIRYAKDDLTIGAGFPTSYLYGYNGSIDEFMVFNHSLSQTEINLLYNSQQ